MIAKKLASATALWGPTPIAKVHYFGLIHCVVVWKQFFSAPPAQTVVQFLVETLKLASDITETGAGTSTKIFSAPPAQ